MKVKETDFEGLRRIHNMIFPEKDFEPFLKAGLINGILK